MGRLDPALVERAIGDAQEGRTRLFIESFLSVRTKNNDVVPFGYPHIIGDLDSKETHYAFVVKPRQVHVSTYHLAKAFAMCATTPYFRAAIVAHEKEATQRLFATAKNFGEFLKQEYPGLLPEMDTERNDMIQFGGHLKSWMYIGTAGGRKFGRSETINFLMLSEMAHYDKSDAEEIWTGAPEAVPKGGHIIVESTPNGIGNLFHAQYVLARNQQTRFGAHFYPWFAHEEYALGPEDGETLVADRIPDAEIVPTPEESDLIATYGLNVRQLRWRRFKKAEKQEKFDQEYPEDDVSCFLATTNTVFPVPAIQAMVKEAHEPIEKRDNGRVRIWRRPHSGHRYTMGVDPAEGIRGKDYSVAWVLDAQTGHHVATLEGYIPPQDFARRAADLGNEYNTALMVIERNNHGHAFIMAAQTLGYNTVYRHREKEATPGNPGKIGLPQTGSSKTLIVDQMRTALGAGDVTIWDKETLAEMTEYQIDDKNEYGPSSTNGHDDRVMAAMLALHGRISQPWLGRGTGVAARRASVALYPEGF